MRQCSHRSAPPYLAAHSGPCIVAGNAFNLHADLAGAWALFPETPVIAVNGASGEVAAFALFSYHPIQFIQRPWAWIGKHNRFGGTYTVHGARFEEGMPWVHHWWGGARGRGGSAWGARKLASLLGFMPVVLCGAPLVPGNYAGHKLGNFMARQVVVDDLLRDITADVDWHEGAFSMSGRTRDLLGEPCRYEP